MSAVPLQGLDDPAKVIWRSYLRNRDPISVTNDPKPVICRQQPRLRRQCGRGYDDFTDRGSPVPVWRGYAVPRAEVKEIGRPRLRRRRGYEIRRPKLTGSDGRRSRDMAAEDMKTKRPKLRVWWPRLSVRLTFLPEPQRLSCSARAEPAPGAGFKGRGLRGKAETSVLLQA